jgi:glycerol-3-phosphate cytidylyltransferase
MSTSQEHKQDKIIGFTASAFDLCHAGHMLMLKDAKNVCDYLIVALHDDPSDVKDLSYRLETGNKPKNRPIMSLEERRTILEGIKYVDEIIVYRTESDLYKLLQEVPFDVRIIGSDWRGKPFTGHELSPKVYFHERNHNYSTTELRERIFAAEYQKKRPRLVTS